MKPKNRIYCQQAGRAKMAFETKEKAEKFIEYNSSDFIKEGKSVPVRSYYCVCCGAWHVTSSRKPSKSEDEDISSQEYVLDQAIKLLDGNKKTVGEFHKDDDEIFRKLHNRFLDIEMILKKKQWKFLTKEKLLSCLDELRDIKNSLMSIHPSKNSINGLLEKVNNFSGKAFSGLYYIEFKEIKRRFNYAKNLPDSTPFLKEEIDSIINILDNFIKRLGIDDNCKGEITELLRDVEIVKNRFNMT